MEPTVWRKAGIGIDFQNPWFAAFIHPEIDPGIATQIKKFPATAGNVQQLIQQRLISSGEIE